MDNYRYFDSVRKCRFNYGSRICFYVERKRVPFSLILSSDILSFCFCRIQKRHTDEQLVDREERKEKKMSIHKTPDLGIRKRIFIQHVPDSGAPSRDKQKRQPY